jgi:hypothetical protein
VSDYRDDRQALRQRVDDLELELGEAKERAADRDALGARVEELEREKAKLEQRLAGRPRVTLPVGILLAVAVGMIAMAAAGIIVMRSSPPRPPPPPPVPTSRKVAPPTRTPVSEPLWLESSTCRCPGDENAPKVVLAFQEGGTLSFGGDVTRFVSWQLRVTSAGGDRRDVALAADVETVPAQRVHGGQVELLMACSSESLVLAQGQRVSAWSVESGQQLWSHALGIPVGSAKSGSLSVRCTPLEQDGKKRIIVPQGSGRLLLDPTTGDEVK